MQSSQPIKIPQNYKPSDPSLLPSDKRFTRSTRAALDRFGHTKVHSIDVCKIPISGALDNLLQILSLKTWNEAKRIQGYDSMFHLYMNITLTTGERCYIEKNSNIVFRPGAVPNKKETISYGEVVLKENITMNQALSKYRDIVPGFFVYSAFKNNCQDFILNCTKFMGIDDPTLKDFILQDIEQITKKLPFFLDKVSRVITDIGGYIGKTVDETTKIDLKLRSGGLV